MSLSGKVSIIGAGCSDFAEHWNRSAEDLIVDAGLEAFADAGIEDPRQQVDAVFAGSLYAPMGPVHVSDIHGVWRRVGPSGSHGLKQMSSTERLRPRRSEL